MQQRGAFGVAVSGEGAGRNGDILGKNECNLLGEGKNGIVTDINEARVLVSNAIFHFKFL